MPVVLDSNFVVPYLRRNPEARRKAEELQRREELVILPAIVVYEVFDGVSARGTERERAEFMALMQAGLVAPLDIGTALTAGQMQAELRRVGEVKPDADVLVAAAARVTGAAVVTNDSDFEVFERRFGVQLEHY